ncbi:hypothetical protein EDD11_005032 [Mortierella claussenii]|nr:hypothetical protein EDD11_005032 [Mortierella claussenii]
MEEKLQEKFALVQQMKREKELKEAKARESQPFDIFAIAGVTLPSSSQSGGFNMTIRHDGPSSSAPSIGSVKRPRKDRTTKAASTSIEESRSISAAGSVGGDLAADVSKGEQKTKLKRSSMAASRVESQQDSVRSMQGNNESIVVDVAPESVQGSTSSEVSAAADSVTEEKSDSSRTATPPTPIPSPKAENTSRRNSGSSSPTRMLAKDMTHNVQSRAGSIDENEEMVVDMFGRSVPRSRHHSSDEGSDSENESADGDRRRRGGGSGGRRGGDRDGRGRDSGDEMPINSAEEVDPYLAASRYLDTAFYPTKIYVGNLPSSISLTSLRTLFAPFGDIDDMNLVEGKDFGFVTYVEPLAAQQALAKMNGAMLDGTYIRVNRAKIPERNRRGFAGVAWMDEDGELARMEEEQHQQAAAIAGGFPATSSGGMPTSGRSSRSPRETSPAPARPLHQLPARPRSPKLPPKPTGAALFPPAGMDPRAAMAATSRGAGRQILRYDDL